MTEGRNRESLTLGVDLGGTKVETSLVDETGHILASHRRPTQPDKGPDRVIADIITCVESCLGEAVKSAQSLGIGMAGQNENDCGMCLCTPHRGCCYIWFQTSLAWALNRPGIVSNEVGAANYGESCYGAGRDVNDLVCLFVGTGVGGGIVSGGRLLEGCFNTAGELGHLTIVTNGRQCHCRNRGCLEAYAGGWAIAERAQEAARSDTRAGELLIKLAGSVGQISAATVTEAYANGDPLAQYIVAETVRYLAAGLVGIVNAFNPCVLVLGGGVIHGLPEYASMVEHIVRLNALEAAVKDLRIVTSVLGNTAGVIGAATLARHKFQKDE